MNNAIFNAGDILETIRMIQDECLDIRTTTMGISLLDCIDSDIHKACDKVYDKITRRAEKLVSTGEIIEKEYGIPIINKRISVTPIAMLAAACPNESPVLFAKTLQRAAETCGVNFIGGYSALVHKGFSAGDIALIRSIPEALSVTERVCSSVNVGSTKCGIKKDAVRMKGKKVKQATEKKKEKDNIKALEDKTIIVNGYIATSMIDVKNLYAKKMAATDVTNVAFKIMSYKSLETDDADAFIRMYDAGQVFTFIYAGHVESHSGKGAALIGIADNNDSMALYTEGGITFKGLSTTAESSYWKPLLIHTNTGEIRRSS